MEGLVELHVIPRVPPNKHPTPSPNQAAVVESEGGPDHYKFRCGVCGIFTVIQGSLVATNTCYSLFALFSLQLYMYTDKVYRVDHNMALPSPGY